MVLLPSYEEEDTFLHMRRRILACANMVLLPSAHVE
jgi:hypothetical protein